jgi:excisionase family DNA binding protein
MIESTYNDFLKLTGEPIAAAMLTLAQVIEHKPESVAMSVKQAAKTMGVSEKTIYRLCEEGRLRHQKVGRAVRILPEDLQTTQAEQAKGGKTTLRHIKFA